MRSTTKRPVESEGTEGELMELRVAVNLPKGLSKALATRQLRAAILNGSVFALPYTGPGDRPCLACATDVRVEFI